jgi:hypothetical protein
MAYDNSGWTLTNPENSDLASAGASEIRSAKSSIASVINDEHYFNLDSASSLSGGVHRAGSARVFAGTRAALAVPSSADSSNRLYYATDTDRLHFLGASSNTTIGNSSQPIGFLMTTDSLLSQPSGDTRRDPMPLASAPLDSHDFVGASQYTAMIPAGLGGFYMVGAFWKDESALGQAVNFTAAKLTVATKNAALGLRVATSSYLSADINSVGSENLGWEGMTANSMVSLDSGESLWLRFESTGSLYISAGKIGMYAYKVGG